jgi:hypothetical protein
MLGVTLRIPSTRSQTVTRSQTATRSKTNCHPLVEQPKTARCGQLSSITHLKMLGMTLRIPSSHRPKLPPGPPTATRSPNWRPPGDPQDRDPAARARPLDDAIGADRRGAPAAARRLCGDGQGRRYAHGPARDSQGRLRVGAAGWYQGGFFKTNMRTLVLSYLWNADRGCWACVWCEFWGFFCRLDGCLGRRDREMPAGSWTCSRLSRSTTRGCCWIAWVFF